MKAAKNIIKDLPLNMSDVARLVLEATEELGEVEWRSAAEGDEYAGMSIVSIRDVPFCTAFLPMEYGRSGAGRIR